MNDRFIDRRPPDLHLHQCKAREDEVCAVRGFCECDCGAKKPYPTMLDQKRNEWAHE